MKKLISCFLTIIILCSMTTGCSAAGISDSTTVADDTQTLASAVSPENAVFTDVPADAEYAAAVAWCYEKGILNGVGGSRFDPDGTLTRAMLVTAIYRAADEPAVDAAPAFTDTRADTWYSSAVVWASQEGLVEGYGGGLFGPNDAVSVEQLSVIIDRYMGRGDTWVGDPNRAIPATRAQVAVALYEALRDAPAGSGNVLVAYFSATGNTEGVAQALAKAVEADLFEIVPSEPYTNADLNYNDASSRTQVERRDASVRPAIESSIDGMAGYDVIFLGYPIWNGIPPRIISTFLESYDLGGKTIVPFCTSASSGFSDEGLPELTESAVWMDGRRFGGSASAEEVTAWVEGLNLALKEDTAVTQLEVSFNGYSYTAELEDNDAVSAFIELINEKGGSLTVSANDYSGFEKVASLGASLPASDVQTTTAAGDFVLYNDNQIVLFYGSNSWSYTRLGRLMGDLSKLKARLGSGDVEITYSLISSVAQFDLDSGENGNAPTVMLNSGYEMPVLGLGTYSLHDETVKNSVTSALNSGVRLIDTAHAYGNEREIGEAIRASDVPREDIFVITKIYPGEQFQNPEQAIQLALDTLDIGYIDMMLLHHPGDNDVNAYLAMEKFVEQGKIRSLGLSNWYIEEIDDFIAQVNIKPALVQNEIHPYYQEQKVVPYMHDLGIVTQAWYPLGGRGHTGELLGNETISAIAGAHDVSSAQVILRWHLQRGVVAIPGSSNPEHILENISVFDFELTDAEMDAIAVLDRNEKHDWY